MGAIRRPSVTIHEMSLPQTIRRYTPREYYQLERAAEFRSDFYKGEIFNISGGTSGHSLICANIVREVGNRLKGKLCTVYDSNLRMQVQSNGLRCYPDVSVYCDRLRYDPEDDGVETVTNPTVLVEVLSKSTEAYDRGFKSRSYRTIESLKAYVLASQTTPFVETYIRQQDGTWQFRESACLTASMSIAPIDVNISLAEIYDRVEFGDSDSESSDKPSNTR
jgi:Uma2 family endonuclease